ncbi:MAG TPA: PAS domain-containing protein, partial [Leptolyngbyaceae cyanobacterium]
MNNSSISPDPQHDEVNTLRQRLLELEGSNHQYQQQVEQLSQQLAQERTARQQAEERLRVVNERFQFAAKAVNCVIYDWNLTSDRIERTDGLTRLLGYSLDETEPTGKWWCDRIHSEDLRSILEQALSALTEEDYFAVEYRILNQSNEYVYVLDQGIVVDRDADGSPTRVVGSTTNISDRKQVEDELRESEQRLQLAQQAGRIGTWEWNLVTDEVSWSDGIWTLLALEPNSITPSRKAFIRFIHPDDREQSLRGVKVALSQGDFYTDEFRVIRQDGVV